MPKFKLPGAKPTGIGQGDRVRKPSVYGEGGRQVGGEARRAMIKRGIKPGAAKPGVKIERPSTKPGVRDVPPAGGHPASLRPGVRMPWSSQVKIEEPIDVFGGSNEEDDPVEEAGSHDPQDRLTSSAKRLNMFFETRVESEREERSAIEQAALVEKAKRRTFILRKPAVKAAPMEEQPEAVDTAQLSLFDAPATAMVKAPVYLPVVSSEPRNAIAQAMHEEAQVTPYTTEQESQIASIMGTPGVICNACNMSENCPQFKEGATCAYDSDLQGLSSRDVNNILPSLEVIADLQKKRALRAVMVEARQANGQLDPMTTRQLEVAAAAAERVLKYKLPMQQTMQRSVAVVSQAQGQAQGGGLLQKLMSGIMGNTQRQAGEIVLNAEGEGRAVESPRVIMAAIEETISDKPREP